jgi:hypothetical protein
VDIYIVITQDRQSGVEVVPFSDEAAAIAFAGEEVGRNARHPEIIEPEDRELNDSMRVSGWVWYCRYGVEGDSVRVVRRDLRGS